MMPEVSVIVPMYNAAGFCERCFGSLLAQDFRAFEVVAVDDCSTDGCAELLQRFWPGDAPPLRILRNERNLGPSGSRNRGLEAARGRYVGFLDHDDALRPGYLRTLYETAEGKGADWVSCGAVSIYPNGVSEPYDGTPMDVSGGWEALSHVLQFKLNLNTWGSLFRRELVLGHGIRFTEGVFEDVFFHLRAMAYASRVIVLKDALYDYYVRGTSLSHNMEKEDYNYLRGFCTVLPMVEPFLQRMREELGLSAGQAAEIRKFFLQLALMRLETSRKQMDGESFGRMLGKCLEETFGGHAVYIRAFLDLQQTGFLREKVREQSGQLDMLASRVELYESALPELPLLNRKWRMAEALLKADGALLAHLPTQGWYEEYLGLTVTDFTVPELLRKQEQMKGEILAWLRGQPDSRRRQFGVCALLLVAPQEEAAPYMDASLWPERLRADFRRVGKISS